jgi:hypothetical protein
MLSILGCKQSFTDWRVKTQYQIHKITFNGQEQISGGVTDTFYYTKKGKPDLSRFKTKTVVEEHENVNHTKTFDALGKLQTESYQFLNEKGYVDSTVYIQNGQIKYRHKYLYDKEGNLAEDRMYQPDPPNSVFQYKLLDGNRVEERVTAFPLTDTVEMINPSTGELEKVVTFFYNYTLYHEFDTRKVNMPTSIHFGLNEIHRKSRNLTTKTVQVSTSGDTLEVYHYRYSFDNKGRILTVVQESRSGTEYDSTSYSYY